MNADLLLVGRYWGAGTLGIYQNARALADELRARLAAPLSQTLFPAFSSVQSDTARVAELFVRSSRVLAAAIMLPGAVLSACASELVALLFGPKWSAMVPLVGVFAASAALRGATALASPLLNAVGRPGVALKHHAIGTVLMVVAALVTLPRGIEAVTLSVALSTAYTIVPYSVAAGVFGFRFRAVVGVFAGPLLAAAVAWTVIAVLRAELSGMGLSALTRLSIFGALGVAGYLLALRAVARPHWADLVALAARVSRRTPQ
jgi:PST family polysaccharide transporter